MGLSFFISFALFAEPFGVKFACDKRNAIIDANSAVIRDAATYEHTVPEKIGNARRVLVSELSGRSNLLYKASVPKIEKQRHEFLGTNYHEFNL
jgi:hypothetical protein